MTGGGSATILGVDPGREKCGLALLRDDRVVRRAVVARGDLSRVIREWGTTPITRIALGGRTGMAAVRVILETALPGVPLDVVEEAGTTLEARRLYFADHPPRGWRRFLPLSLQLPPEAYDDYAAVALARRLTAGRPRPQGSPRKLD